MQPPSNRWPAPIWARSPLLRLQDMNARLAYFVAALVGLIVLAPVAPVQMLNGFELKNSLVPPTGLLMPVASMSMRLRIGGTQMLDRPGTFTVRSSSSISLCLPLRFWKQQPYLRGVVARCAAGIDRDKRGT